MLVVCPSLRENIILDNELEEEADLVEGLVVGEWVMTQMKQTFTLLRFNRFS